MGESVQKYRISWESFGHDKVRKESDRVDQALGAVAESVDDITKRTDAGSRSTKKYNEVLGASRSHLEAVDRAADQAAQGLDRVEDRTTSVTNGFKGMGAAIVGALGAVGASELLRLAEEGSALQVISRRLDDIGFSAEQTEQLASRLGGGSTAAIERLASRAAKAGLDFDQMQVLADAALQTAIDKGEDAGDIFEKLTKAIQTGKPKYLAQLGLQVDLTKAQEAYAESIGKSAKELTAQEKIAANNAAAISELNRAFGGKAPDKYASNIGAVRDRLDNLADLIKRKLADALNDLGAALSGGSFASDHKESRAADAAQKTRALERLLVKLEAAEGQANEESAALIKRAASQINEQVDLDKARTVKITRFNREVMRVTSYDADVIEAARQAMIERVRSNIATQKTHTAALKAAEPDDKPVPDPTSGPVARARSLADEVNEWLREAGVGVSGLVDKASELDALLKAPTAGWLGDDIEELVVAVEAVDSLSALTDDLLGSDRPTLGEVLGLDDLKTGLEETSALFETLGEGTGHIRTALNDVSSTVGLMGQMAALESGNAIQRARNRARDAKGEKERLAAEQAILKAEREAEKERRQFQVADFALKAADNVGAAIEEAGKAAGSYPDPVGIAMHTFAALKHGAAAAFYGSGAVNAASAPSSVGGASGLGGTPSAPTPADNPRREQGGSSSSTTIILNGVMADGRSVRTAVVDGLNAVGDGQLPVEEGF